MVCGFNIILYSYHLVFNINNLYLIYKLYFFCQIDNINLLQNYIRNNCIKNKSFNKLILYCCDLGRFNILKWLSINEFQLLQNKKEEINYNKPCLRALNHGYLDIVNY